jgi:XTP/dITP diphosphohydrolase
VIPVDRNAPPARTTLVLATRNLHKVAEMSALLRGLPLDILSCRDLPGVPDVVEDAPTLEGNAIKKAVAAHADDTGLEVEFLGGAPGVLSARYAGDAASYEDNNRKLLAALDGVPAQRRRAVFRCVVALAKPGLAVRLVEGRTEGGILERPRGDGGFGYDPLFLPAGHVRTYAEMAADEKNLVSHRGKAVRAARSLIAELLGTQHTLGQ